MYADQFLRNMNRNISPNPNPNPNPTLIPKPITPVPVPVPVPIPPYSFPIFLFHILFRQSPLRDPPVDEPH